MRRKKKQRMIVRVGSGGSLGHRGYFVVRDDSGDTLELQRVVTLRDKQGNTKPALADYVTIRKGSHRVVKPRLATLKRKGLA